MSKSKIVSAGVLLKCGSKYLIAHPTELTGTTHGWGIPKGKVDPMESIYTAALREFREETGLDLETQSSVLIEMDPWTTFKVGSSKKVYVFRAWDEKEELINYPFKCISFVHGHTPEIDAYQWIEPEDALAVVTTSQIKLFAEVIKQRKKNNG